MTSAFRMREVSFLRAVYFSLMMMYVSISCVACSLHMCSLVYAQRMVCGGVTVDAESQDEHVIFQPLVVEIVWMYL
jgi:hypothetical protein